MGSSIDPDCIEHHRWVGDPLYFGDRAPCVGKENGCRTLPGGGMTVFQAAVAFELFTGLSADTERTLRHFDDLCRVAA
ncbi:shikimate 5-dehydrogenase [Rhizobium sp. BK650]|uniref:hypothetical protein n=1 Tax=Rhizobium sp. BK650 TaxID=2586990 RepID=UPI00161B272A|nr:shikimate 5-dehydrogenase [Rhizobium sp. BK650]